MTKLDELERLLAKATPGPWARCHDTVVLAEDGFTTVCGLASDDIGTGADIAAIAALRNLAPKLIAVARAAEARFAVWTKETYDNLRDALDDLDKT
jgi:hypothetical protein